jgi:hypothetical protein
MWPWEHLAVGYLCYSLVVHLFARRAPRGGPVIALAVGTQFPDLVDKPLAWTLGVLPAGHSLAHSLFVALPVSALAITVAWTLDRRQVGAAFAFGYLSHLPADVLYPVLIGREANVGFLFWPLVPAVESGTDVGFVAMVRALFGQYVTELGSATLSPYLALELGLFLAVFLLWLYDGMPPLRSLWSRFRLGIGVEETS